MQTKDQSQILLDIYTKTEVFRQEITRLEFQLKNVNTRIHHLHTDLYFYAGFILLILPLYLLKFLFDALNFGIYIEARFIGIVGLGALELLRMVYLILLPFMLYSLFYNIQVQRKNREPENYIWVPTPLKDEKRYLRNPAKPKPEDNFYIERYKLVTILSKYYVYSAELKELLDQVQNSLADINAKDLSFRLNNMCLFEEVGISSVVTHVQNKKIKFVSLFLGLVLFGLFLYFTF